MVLKNALQEQQAEHEWVEKLLMKTFAHMCPPSSKNCCLPSELLHEVLGHCFHRPKDLAPALDAYQTAFLLGFFHPHGVKHHGILRALLSLVPLNRHWMAHSPVLSALQGLTMYQ